MSRNLIDRDVLLEKAKQKQRFYKDEYDAMESGYLDEERAIVEGQYSTMTDCVSLISNAPTIDAVEVVLCKYCIHGITGHGIADGWVLCSKPYATDTVGGAMHRCDWFCGDGNRKEQNDD